MKIADSNNQKYASYKNNLIFESIISTPDRDRFYGLSREHIELTLGIKIPLLLESIDFKLEDKILREQYLFEQWAQSLRTAAGAIGGAAKAAGSAVTGAAKGVATAATGAATNAVGAVIGKVKDTAGIFKALGLIIQYPTLVTELGQSVSQEVNKFLSPIQDFLGKVITWCRDKTQKIFAYVKSAFNGAHNTITGLLQKFRALSGWQKVALGAGLSILGTWVWNKIGPKVEALKKKIESAIGEKTIEAAKVAKDAAGAARTGGARAAVGAGVASIANKSLGDGMDEVKEKAKEGLTELGKQLIPELQELAKSVITKLGGAATLATLSAFTGPIGPFLLSVAGIVGNANLIVTTLAPITNSFIDKYNMLMGNNPHMGISARGASLGPSTTPTFVRAADAIGRGAGAVRSAVGRGASTVGQAAGAVRSAVGLEEHRVLLRDIIYE